MSEPDNRMSAANATTYEVVIPRATVAIPNRPTTINKVRPTCRVTGRDARKTAMIAAPIPGAARSHPYAMSPTFSWSSAIAGKRATAPPKSTANRSNEIAANKMGVRRINRNPSRAVCRETFSALLFITRAVCDRRNLIESKKVTPIAMRIADTK